MLVQNSKNDVLFSTIIILISNLATLGIALISVEINHNKIIIT